ncbi:fibrinogen-like protein A [Apostichopus japonicus]|uniref:fibrinogen-like protein A n=1 Tax=Stichopus japonicus TaxID=307972 RepID=UPI003AB55E93
MQFILTFLICGLFSQIPAFQAENNVGRENSGRNKRSTGDSSYFFYQEPEYPRDCKEVYDQCEGSSSESGIYLIKPDGANEPFQVYCNNSIDGGGWTVRT